MDEEDPFKVESLKLACPMCSQVLPSGEIDALLLGSEQEINVVCPHCGVTVLVRLDAIDKIADDLIQPL